MISLTTKHCDIRMIAENLYYIYIYIVIFFMADFKQLWQNQKPAVIGAGVLFGAGLLALIFSIVFIIK